MFAYEFREDQPVKVADVLQSKNLCRVGQPHIDARIAGAFGNVYSVRGNVIFVKHEGQERLAAYNAFEIFPAEQFAQIS